MRAGRLTMVALALVLAGALSACGSNDGSQPGAAKRSAPSNGSAAGRSGRDVIRAWADTLRDGDVAKAASYFALPAIVQNGTAPLKLTTLAEVRVFNASLPCGARVLRTYSASRYTIAVFRLTERPGPGRCGQGTGKSARTAFVIRKGKIREWRRVADRPNITAPVV